MQTAFNVAIVIMLCILMILNRMNAERISALEAANSRKVAAHLGKDYSVTIDLPDEQRYSISIVAKTNNEIEWVDGKVDVIWHDEDDLFAVTIPVRRYLAPGDNGDGTFGINIPVPIDGFFPFRGVTIPEDE